MNQMRIEDGPSCENDRKINRISNLPDHIIEKILSHLPIRDAVRTSVLATKWRYRWASLPSVVFDERDFPLNNEDDFATELSNIIDYVLSHHLSPIQKFKLVFIRIVLDRNVDRWILHLSRSFVKEFALKHANTKEYQIPSCLFSWQSLTRLSLSDCFVTLPLWFKGFPNLKSLSLKDVTFNEPEYEYDKLITSCPLLERLVLRTPEVDDNISLNVDAPYLQDFELQAGGVSEFTLRNTPCLAVASIHVYLRRPMSLLESLANLPKLRKLEFGTNLVECVCNGILVTEMPKLGAHVQHFSAEINFRYWRITLGTLIILQGASNLEKLNISLLFPSDDLLFEEDDNISEFAGQNFSFAKLRCVTISKIEGGGFEIDFIGGLLLYSPVLESMTVTVSNGFRNKKNKRAVIKKLRGFHRASPLAQLTILDS